MVRGDEKYAREIHKAGIYATEMRVQSQRTMFRVQAMRASRAHTYTYIGAIRKIERVNASTAIARRELMKNIANEKRSGKI